MIFITPKTISRPAETMKSIAAVVMTSSASVSMLATGRDERGEGRLLPARRPSPYDFRFGHCAPGSTSGKLWMTFTLPSACTWPRYIVNGA